MQHRRPLIVVGASMSIGLAAAAVLAEAAAPVVAAQEAPLPGSQEWWALPPRPPTKRERIEALKQADADRAAKQKAQRTARRRNRRG